MSNEQLQKELRELFKRTIDPIDPDRQYIDFLVEKSMEYMGKHTDNVNHPKHYKMGKYETIDVIKDITASYEGYQGYLVGNILKYLARSPHKGDGLEDLKKAQFYLNLLVKEQDDT